MIAAETAVSPLVKTLVEHSFELVSTVLLTAVFPAVLAFLKARQAESATARMALVVTEAAASAVAVVDRDMKPKVMAALADGVLTDKEKAELRDEALRILRVNVAPEVWNQAKASFGPLLEGWLKGLIERAVTERRTQTAGAAGQAAAGEVKTATDAANAFEAAVAK